MTDQQDREEESRATTDSAFERERETEEAEREAAADGVQADDPDGDAGG